MVSSRGLQYTSGRRALDRERPWLDTVRRVAGWNEPALLIVFVVRAAGADHLLLRRERPAPRQTEGRAGARWGHERLVGCRAL